MKAKLYGKPYIGVALRMLDRYKDDAADQHAAAIGFFGFLSLFPLLLLAVAAASMFLSESLKVEVVQAIIDAIPGFGDAFASGDGGSPVASIIDSLEENAGAVGLVGAVSLLVTGLKVINSANVATLQVFHVDVKAKGFMLRLRQLFALVALGILAILGVAAAGFVGAAATIASEAAGGLVGGGDAANGALQLGVTVAGYAGSIAADLLLFLFSFKLLSYGKGPRFRQLIPGAMLAAVGWTALKLFGATYVTSQISKTNASVGALGGVVGLMLLLYLAGRVYMYGAELTSVVRRPGADLADRYDNVTYEGEDPDVLPQRGRDQWLASHELVVEPVRGRTRAHAFYRSDAPTLEAPGAGADAKVTAEYVAQQVRIAEARSAGVPRGTDVKQAASLALTAAGAGVLAAKLLSAGRRSSGSS